jgi:hypothetical protein
VFVALVRWFFTLCRGTECFETMQAWSSYSFAPAAPRRGALRRPIPIDGSGESRHCAGVSVAPFRALENTSLSRDRFVIQRRLGQGAMGVVYAAHDRQRNRQVAIKTLAHLDATSIFRLKNEFRALSNLSHPNFIGLHELLFAGGQWLLTMDLVDGVDFLRWVRPEPDEKNDATAVAELDLERLRAAAVQLADALGTLHGSGRVHLDIKPSNVLVDRTGHVVLLDFELVRGAGADDEMEELLVGTPDYVAPEIVLGRGAAPASDWYAFGTMLYEALTGRLPFTGDPSRVLIRKCSGDPAPPQALSPELPEDLCLLCQALLDRDPTRRPGFREIMTWLGAAPGSERSIFPKPPISVRAPLLIGREQELTRLTEMLGAVVEGRTGVVFVAGASGMGKTALVSTFLEAVRAKGTALVLSGRCFERESVPFKAFDNLVDALARHLLRLPESDRALLIPSDFALLARVFPVLESLVPEHDPEPSSEEEEPDPQELRRRAFSAMGELMRRLTERQPLVLWIDDLQWGDVDSASLLEALLRRALTRLLVIGSYRSEDVSTSPFVQSQLVQGLSGVTRQSIHLEPLLHEKAVSLALALTSSAGPEAEGQAQTVAFESEGNPFFLMELLRYVEDREAQRLSVVDADGEVKLSRVINDRVQRLAPEARHFFELVSVARRPVEVRVLASAVALSDVDGVVSLLRAAQLIRTRSLYGADSVQAFHDRIAEAVLSELPADVLGRRHLELAESLERSPSTDAEWLVVHFREAGEPGRAGLHAVKAADQASRTLAFDRAARLYRWALELGSFEREAARQLRIKLGDALANAGRGPEAARAYLDASEGANAALVLDLRRRAGEQLARAGYIEEGLNTTRKLLEAVNVGQPATPRSALLSLIWRRLRLRLRGLGFQERPESECTPADLERVDVCWSATVVTGMVDTIRGAETQARHLELALALGEPYRVCRALCLEAAHAASEGVAGRRRFERLLSMATALAARVPEPHARGLSTLAAAMGAWLLGRWRETIDLSQRANSILRSGCSGARWEIANASFCLACALTMRGELDAVGNLSADLLEEARARGDLYARWTGVSGWPVLHLVARGEGEQARDQIRQLVQAWPRDVFSVQHHWARLATALVDLYAGAPSRALEDLNASLVLHRRAELWRIQIVRIDVNYLRACCLIAGLRRDDASERADLDRTIAALRGEGAAWSTCLARVLEATLEDGEAAARALVTTARELDALDMHLFARAARVQAARLSTDETVRALGAESEQYLRERGASDPVRLASTVLPLPTWRAS